MLRSKPIMPKPALPFAKAWPVRSARRRQPGATRLCASGRKRRGRTSMQESRATGPTSLPSCCSEVYPDPPARPSHEREHDTLTRDASDKELLELRSRGRCDAALYNHVRPHSSLGNRTPAQARRTFVQDDSITPGALVQASIPEYSTARLSL